MKKLFLLALLLPALLSSCSSDNNPVTPEDGKGSIRLNTEIKMASQTRGPVTPAFADLTIVLSGPDETSQTLPWPAGGLIENLEPGSYTVKVTTHADGMPASGFDGAYWEGTATATVEEGQTKPVPVSVSLQNGGVFFNYVPALADVNVVPTVTDADGVAIQYPDKTENVAYFAPESTVTVTATIDGVAAKVNGADSKTLPIQAGHVWKVTLQETDVEGGSITINVIFEEASIEDLSYGVKPGEDEGPEPDYIIAKTVIEASYLGDSTVDDASEFQLNIQNNLGEGFCVSGFTHKQPFETFALTEGTYTFQNKTRALGDPMSLYPGTMTSAAIFPTFGGVWISETDLAHVYFAVNGTMKVANKPGGNVEIKLVFSGYYLGVTSGWQVTPFEGEVAYKYEGPISWEDKGPQTPPASVEWADVPAKMNYTLDVSDNIFDSIDGTISGTMIKQTVNGVKRVVLTHWVHMTRKEGEPIISVRSDMYPLILNYDERRKVFYVDQATPMLGTDSYGTVTAFWRGALSNGKLVTESHQIWVGLDLENNKLDLSYSKFGEENVYLGAMEYYGQGVIAHTEFIRGMATLSPATRAADETFYTPGTPRTDITLREAGRYYMAR